MAQSSTTTGVDPGFPIGGHGPILGGHGPLIWVLFGENVCENKRIGSHRGHVLENFVCRSANAPLTVMYQSLNWELSEIWEIFTNLGMSIFLDLLIFSNLYLEPWLP